MSQSDIEKGDYMEFDFEDSEFGLWEAECQACDIVARVDDLGLCEECSAKFDRDMIRQRYWDYAASAFGVPPEKREDLRSIIVREYGNSLELISPEQPEPPPGDGHGGKSNIKDDHSGR